MNNCCIRSEEHAKCCRIGLVLRSRFVCLQFRQQGVRIDSGMKLQRFWFHQRTFRRLQFRAVNRKKIREMQGNTEELILRCGCQNILELLGIFAAPHLLLFLLNIDPKDSSHRCKAV